VQIVPLLVGAQEEAYLKESSTVVSSYLPGRRALMGAVLSEHAMTRVLPNAPARAIVDLKKAERMIRYV
jgi:hypothetical protein